MLATFLSILKLMASDPRVMTFVVGIMPPVLRIAKAIQDEILSNKAAEKLQGDINATVDSLLSDALSAARNDPGTVESYSSDPQNRDRFGQG